MIIIFKTHRSSFHTSKLHYFFKSTEVTEVKRETHTIKVLHIGRKS